MFRQTTLLGLALGLASLSSAQVSSDFESGWDQTAWPTYAPDCSQGGSVTLDSTTAHSGKNSIRVDGAGGYCGHIFFGTTKVPSSGDFYVRTWVKMSKPFGDSHVTWITMLDPAEGTNKHLRVSGQMGIIEYNRESDDATLPELSPQGIASSATLPTGDWQCFEYHVGADGTLETWLNGNAIAGLSYGPKITNANAAAWGRSSIIPKPTAVYFGWESYGSDTNTLWYDDVAIATSRIGCGSGSVSSASSAASSTSTKPISSTTLITSTTSTSKVSTTTPITSKTSTTSSAAPATTTASGCKAAQWAQCDGIGYTGCKTCASPYTCKYSNDWYSQCL